MRLVTPEGLSVYLRREIADDDLLARLVCEMATEVVRNYTNQLLHFVNDDEVFIDGTGYGSLCLPQLPVVRVNAVTTFDFRGLNEMDLIADTDYRVGDGGVLWRIGWWGFWPAGHRNIKVNYDHGYDVGEETIGSGSASSDSSALDPVPPDLLLIALQVAARAFLAGSTAGGLSSETIGKYSYQLSSSQEAGNVLTGAEMRVLDRYRARAIA